MNIDALTGQALPANAIQRVLFLCPNAHVYQIPPLRSTKGHSASDWTRTVNPTAQEIFQPRIRLLETAIPAADGSSEQISVSLLLEDRSNGELFAAVPYNDAGAVEPAIDSSRFFAIRVVGEGGRKAVLGLGFEERSDAVDFSISLQDARKTLGWEKAPPVGGAAQPTLGGNNAAAGGPRGRRQAPSSQQQQQQQQHQQQFQAPAQEKRDFRLKEGEMITVNLGGKGRRSGGGDGGFPGSSEPQDLAKFALKPPPGGGNMPLLAPPPTTREVKERGRRSLDGSKLTAKDLGFDDGEFGEFQ